jgi:hypothetical protein
VSERTFLTTNALSDQLHHKQQQTRGRKPPPSKKGAIPRLDKVQTGRVEKKVITIADLNKAVNLTKKISSGGKQGTSGSNLPPNPVVTRLLALVDDLRQGGVLPTAQSSSSTKTEAAPDHKVSRRQRKLEAKIKRYNEIRFDGPCFGSDPTLKSIMSKLTKRTRRIRVVLKMRSCWTCLTTKPLMDSHP